MAAPPTTIVAPLDGSVLAEAGVEYAAMLAGGLGASLTLFTAVGGEERTALDSFAAGEGISLDDAANIYLRRIAESIAADLHVETHYRLSDHPASAILDFVGDSDTTMIVMASHGRSGVTRWLLGSVADKVVQSSIVPVVVVSVRDR